MSLLSAAAQQPIYRTKGVSKGTILFFADGELKTAAGSANFFAKNGFDVVITGSPVNNEKKSHDLAIVQGIGRFRQLQQKNIQPELKSNRLLVFGVGSGGHVAAEVVRRLGPDGQPSELILVNPVALDETVPGTVLPAVRPPLQPAGRLILLLNTPDSATANASVIMRKHGRGTMDKQRYLRCRIAGGGSTVHRTRQYSTRWERQN